MIKQIPIGSFILKKSTSRREDSYENENESGEVITRPCMVYNDVWAFAEPGWPSFLEIYEDTWVDDYYGSDSDGKYIGSQRVVSPRERRHIREFLNWDYEADRIYQNSLISGGWLDRWQIEDLKSLLRRSFNFEKLQSTLNYPRGDIL